MTDLIDDHDAGGVENPRRNEVPESLDTATIMSTVAFDANGTQPWSEIARRCVASHVAPGSCCHQFESIDRVVTESGLAVANVDEHGGSR